MSNSYKSDSESLVGQSVGDFELLRRLGSGGMAEVYLAEQKSLVACEVVLRRNVALKILRRNLSNDDSYVKRFHREAQAVAGLVQSNIVQIYEVGESEGVHFIAQEYVRGRNLKQYLNRFGAVEPEMAVNVLKQTGMALQKASEMGVIHRDIKPENIMLSTNGEVKVADFGLARINDQRVQQDLTQIGITMGTPLYMSPEQVEGNEVDVRSDIYSLGVTAYHMLAGHPPYDGENALAIAVQHINSAPQPLQQIRPDAPDDLIQLVDRMMSKSPSDRPENASQLIKEIKGIKIEPDQDWEQLVETLALDASATMANILPDPRLAATKQLQSVMKGNVRSWWTELSTILGFLLLACCGVFIGLWSSNQFPLTDPLGALIDNASVPIQQTAKRQYEFAVINHDRKLDYYQAVIDFHPVDSSKTPEQTKKYHLRAMERQSELYLINKEFEKAKDIYETFIISNFEPRFVTVGHAGLAIFYHERNNAELAQQEFELADSNAKAHLNQFLLSRFNKIRRIYSDSIAEGKMPSKFTASKPQSKITNGSSD